MLEGGQRSNAMGLRSCVRASTWAWGVRACLHTLLRMVTPCALVSTHALVHGTAHRGSSSARIRAHARLHACMHAHTRTHTITRTHASICAHYGIAHKQQRSAAHLFSLRAGAGSTATMSRDAMDILHQGTLVLARV